MYEEFTTTYLEDKPNPETIKLLCSHCASRNNHTVVHSSHEKIDSKYMWFHSEYCIVRCNGCDQQSFCILARSSEDIDDYQDPETGEIITGHPLTIEQYPRVNIRYKAAEVYFSAQLELRKIYNETYAALCEGSAKLASVGMRVIIEVICALHNITDEVAPSLPRKIKELHDRTVISKGVQEIILSVKDFGDIGAHTLRTPTADELETAWNVINIMISSIYGTEDAKNRIVSMRGFRKDGKVPKSEPF